jgi:hypothetical protein
MRFPTDKEVQSTVGVMDPDEVLLGFPHQIGQPLVMCFGDKKVYGRIVGLEGTRVGNQYPIIIFCSPHGTEVRTGIAGLKVFSDAHFEVPNEEDMRALQEFEQQALAMGNWYNDKLPKSLANKTD